MAEIDTIRGTDSVRARRRVSLLDVQLEFARHPDNALFLAVLCVIAIGLLATGPALNDVLWLALGLLIFIPQEYYTHVHVLHRAVPATRRLYDWFYRLHYGHHDHPRRHDLMYMPAWLTLPMMAGNLALLWLVMPDRRAFAAAYGGALLGYLAFEFSHLLCHVPYVPTSRIWRHVRTLHLLHHFSNEKAGFSVAPWSLFMDRVMGTPIQREDAPRSATCRHLGLDAGHPWISAARARYRANSNGDATGSRLWLRKD